MYKVAELPLLNKINHHENTIRKVKNWDILELLNICASLPRHAGCVFIYTGHMYDMHIYICIFAYT